MRIGTGLLTFVGVVLLASVVVGQTSTTTDTISRIQSLTKSAADAFKAKEFAASATQIVEAQRLLEQLTADLVKEYSRIEKAHQLLRDNGHALPELKSLADLLGVADDAPVVETNDAATTDPPATTQVSFTNDVVPILSQHCGICHIRQTKGRFSAASYASLMKGPPKGAVVVAGEPDNSELLTLIESGKMPPRSKGFPQAELQTLRDWIDQGATFDGTDESEPISAAGQSGPPSARPGFRGRGSN